jgi:Ca2+-binding EF-hand superfamily protein
MGGFARSFGAKRLRELERAFDSFAARDAENIPQMHARDILEAFHMVGKAVTVTKLQEWMSDADVRPQDTLTLADFVSTYAFFFGPAREAGGHVLEEQSAKGGGGASGRAPTRYTLAEIAVQVLQEERWRGTPEQTQAFVRRLCAGRPDAAVDCVARIRDAFEDLDKEDRAEVSVSQLSELFRLAKIPLSAVDRSVKKFSERAQRQSRGTFSLPELFEFFGPELQEATESSISISEAFAMLRLHCSSADVRAAADMALKIVDNIILHHNDPKYWQVNVKSDVSASLLGN